MQTDSEKAAIIEAMKQEILRKILTKEAKERLGRVKMVNPVLATQLETYLLQLYQAGQIKKAIDDSMLRKILESFTKKKEGKIRIIKK
mgnify:CR=1 FL=1